MDSTLKRSNSSLAAGMIILLLLLTVNMVSASDHWLTARHITIENYQHILDKYPPVDLNDIPEDSYYKGQLQITITRQASEYLKDDLLYSETGYVKTGIPALDKLNEKYSIFEYRPSLYGVYEISPNSLQRRDLHKNWGFHLIFNLSFREDVDVISAARTFMKADEIDLAEPVFIKEIFEPLDVEEVLIDDNPPTRFRPNDPHYNEHQWALNNTGQVVQNRTGVAGCDISAEAAWEIEKGHEDVVVAVFDNGLNYRHSDLRANIWEGIGPDGEDIARLAHGTHVAGTVAAVTNNNIGVAGIAGGSGEGDGVRLMGCNIFDTPRSYESQKIYAADNGAAISQNSWGYRQSGTYNQADLRGITYFNGNAGGEMMEGGVTIFAAGNDGQDTNRYPAYFDNTFAVASTTNRDLKSGFSNYGEWVHISAPGTSIANTAGNGYVWMSGTSMACPHVSGVAALVLSHAHRARMQITNEQLLDLLMDSADDIDGRNPNFAGRIGAGRVNAHAALELLVNEYMGIRNPETFSAEAVSGDTINLSWQPNEEGDEVMIIWTREPNSDLGFPTEGTFYDIGHNIPGGGKVLYRGADTTYAHTGLDAGRTYYYSAFSYSDLFDYSMGFSVDETTVPPTFELPFSEDFNYEPEIPAKWRVIDHFYNGQKWQVGRFDEGVEGTSGYYVYINSSEYGEDDTQNTQLLTPSIDMSEAEHAVTVQFTHYFEEAPNSTGTLFYSLTGGSNWQFFEMWNTSTENPEIYAAVIPELAGHSEVKFRWGYFGRGAQHWSIDDIEIFETTYLPPVNLRAAAEKDDEEAVSVTLGWDHVQLEEKDLAFNVYREGELMNQEPLQDTTYIDSDFRSSGIYEYYVTTLYEEEESLPSRKVKVEIEVDGDVDPGELHPPRHLKYSVEGYDVHLTWEPPKDFEADTLLTYYVYRNEEKITEEPVADTSFRDEALSPDNEFTYYITAYYDGEESEPSNKVKVILVSVDDDTQTPVITALKSNYPNPFNPETTIRFSLENDDKVRIEVFNIRGNRVRTLLNEQLNKGSHQIVWNGKDESGSYVSSGVYLYRLRTSSFDDTKKMILMK